jgi:glucosamine 6-phosphate synthetase-like amidotransferase/phosphosugar isomerase protein
MKALNMEEQYRRIAEDILAEARDVLYLGRGSAFPIALEGALKLKEISYIHAEGYAGGEMKHGPIALIDEAVPVVVVAPTDAIFDKIASNFEQVKARGGKLVLLSDAGGHAAWRQARRRSSCPGRSDRGADPLHRAGAAAGLLHRGRQGHRRRPAAQSRQERDVE